MPDVDAILPTWLVLPLGALTLIMLAGHLMALHAATDIEPRRRRIRMTNAVLMMVAVPFVAYGFGVATPSAARAFVYVWVVTAALLTMIIMVALIDMLHSWRLHRLQLRDLRRHLAVSRATAARARMDARRGG